MRYLTIAVMLLFLNASCTHTHDEAEVHEGETHAKTVWSEKSELFMEYDEPRPGSKTGFLIHLTRLQDFSPVTEGTLSLTFTPEKGDAVTVTVDKPEKPGIFRAEVIFREAGHHSLTALINGQTFSDQLTVEDIDVVAQGEEHEEDHGEGSGGADIVFLKEQQWSVDFMTGPPLTQTVSASFVATGEIVPVANAEATVSSPVAGILSLSQKLPYTGKRIVKGEVIAVIEPPVVQQGGLGQIASSHAEAKNRVIAAQREYERAQRLYDAKAVPKRRLEEAELGLETARAALDPIERAMQTIKPGASGDMVILRAPFSGTVAELSAANGKAIEAGQPVLRIINTSSVWLKANVPATEIGGLKNLDKAVFRIPGIEEVLRPSRLVAVSDMVDQKARTVAVLFEVDNPGGILKIGMFADVAITTGHIENALTLPEDALFEDEGRFFVFVQKEGESFSRREVKAGIRGNGNVQILSGIGVDERVVLRGGYYVKLASMSSRMPDAHAGHAH